MSDDEDDYLSDKFLASLEAPKSSSSKTYSEIRKESKLRSERLQQTNRVKSRRERELEAREEALSKTLFERAEEDAQKAGDGGGNKALAMMMKMGFKPGQALGQEDGVGKGLTKVPDEEDLAPSYIATQTPDPTPPSPKRRGNLKEPLPLNEWMGKKGIGLGGKRALSPSAIESMAKAAKLTESADIDTFRNRTREEYLERQAEGRLRAAQKTCETQDAEAGITFNVFWINPEVPETIPPQLLRALGEDAYVLAPMAARQRALNDVQARLHLNMKSDALEPELPLDVVEETRPQEEVTISSEDFDEETIAKATAFLRLSFTERLVMILAYLRDRYHYCFWCGTQYKSGDELETSCPGTNEEDHD